MSMTRSAGIIFGEGPVRFQVYYQNLQSDQGVTVEVLRYGSGEDTPILRFNCFDHEPHYLYIHSTEEEKLLIDCTTEGDPLEWALNQISTRLPEMVTRAGFQSLGQEIDVASISCSIDNLGNNARKIAQDNRSTVIHNRGDVIIEAGSIKFGVEFRELDEDNRGVAIHVLGDVNGEELELLTFDCFDIDPHYHYGPRAKNQILYLDQTTTPNALRWALDLFKGGKLSTMLERAGYAEHAAKLNPAIVANRVAELESVALKIQLANTQGS